MPRDEIEQLLAAGPFYDLPDKLIHAANERIGVDVYKRGIEFYVAFLANLGQL